VTSCDLLNIHIDGNHDTTMNCSGRAAKWTASGYGSNLGQVVYSHCLPSLLSFNKLRYKRYKREFSDWTDLTA